VNQPSKKCTVLPLSAGLTELIMWHSWWYSFSNVQNCFSTCEKTLFCCL